MTNKPKILFINTVYGIGSTGKIVADLFRMSENRDYEAYVAYGRGPIPSKNSLIDNPDHFYRIGNKPDFYSHVLSNFVRGNSGFASTYVTRKFLKWLDSINPSIINIHNLHGFYIHVGMLFEYIKAHNIKVVWTFHDCWPFTGQCSHFDYAGCNRWMTGCHNCPIYRSDYPYSIFKDNSIKNYAMKKASFTGVSDLTIVTPSNWLANLVKQSFLKDYPVTVIHNGINTDIFNIVDKSNYGQIYNKYPTYELDNKKILLAVANVWDSRKGLQYILNLSNDFNSNNGYQVVLIGLTKKQVRTISKKHPNILPITRTSNQKELALWYNMAYAYINPTLQDNYPTTNLEAIACETPVITFNTGGSPETIPESNLGIIVPKEDYSALCNAIKELDSSSNNKASYENNSSLSSINCFLYYYDLFELQP